MCGIAGFTTLKRGVSDPAHVIREMTATIISRGPDGEGYHVDDGIVFGHRRLSIIDIEGGNQPKSAANGRYQIVFNGEIYNYIELRETLKRLGHRFKTESDTEVLIKSFAEYGPGCLEHLNGMFAFAVWDAKEKSLFLARDRVGIKPLYYAVHSGNLIFASELKALMKYPGLPREYDPLSVSKYFTYGYIPSPHTIFNAVSKLEPGTYLTFSRGITKKHLYWDIPLKDNPISARNLDECGEDLIHLLRDSVSKRLRSDVPVGVFLSGGVDSSAMTALAAQAVSGQLHTFSVGFEESSYDESPYARQVAEMYSTNHHHEVLSMKRALDLLPQAMGILDEPFGDASILPTYLLSQFTSQHVKVVLGGDGGDELFAGYPAFQAHRLVERLSFLPMSMRDMLNRMVRRMPVSHRYASLEYLLGQFLKGLGISPEIRFFLWLGPFSGEQKRGLLTQDLQSELLRKNPYEDVLNYVRQSSLNNDFERILYLCMKLYLQDDILVKVDRASMAHSLEVRVPLLDHNVIEYASGIQPDYKLKGMTTKYVFKRALKDLLPKEIIHRRKAGFMIPVAQWINNDLKDWVEDLCNPEELAQDGLFDPAYVRQILDEHYRQERDNRKLIWTLVSFQLWKRNYG